MDTTTLKIKRQQGPQGLYLKILAEWTERNSKRVSYDWACIHK
jgi:hypothetical protein